MDRHKQLLQLRAALAEAGAQRDWDRLGVFGRALAPRLATLAAAGPWTTAELAALAQLRAAHDQAALACNDAVGTLAQGLDGMRANKEGWIAYALDNDSTPEQP
jgi:ABC-type transporter Mla subunit MlaD